MSASTAWAEFTTIRDLTRYSKFERGFRNLQAIAEKRTGTPLLFSRTFLKAVFDAYREAAVAAFGRDGRMEPLSSLSAQMPWTLTGALMQAFDLRYFDRGGDHDTKRFGISRATIDPNRYFALAFCVEYYLFLTYRRLGHDYLPSFDPQDIALVEHILDQVRLAPAGSTSASSYQTIFRNLTSKLAFDPG